MKTTNATTNTNKQPKNIYSQRKQLLKKIRQWEKHTKPTQSVLERLDNLRTQLQAIDDEITRRETNIQHLIDQGKLMPCPSFQGLYVMNDTVYRIRFGVLEEAPVYPIRKTGYHLVKCNNKNVCEHRVVADAYYGPCPSGYEVDHKNFTRGDNRHANLRYLTITENRKRTEYPRGSGRDYFKNHPDELIERTQRKEKAEQLKQLLCSAIDAMTLEQINEALASSVQNFVNEAV